MNEMNFHKFESIRDDDDKCRVCGLLRADHICTVCDNEVITKYIDFALCETHYQLELAAQKELESTADARIKELETRIPDPRIFESDTTIQVASDIFNANIASIEELRKEIESDPTIEDKHFELARRLESRIIHLKSVISEASNTIRESQSKVRAIQTYYNDLGKRLREDQRKLIQIQDTRYAPPEKPVKKPKVPTVRKTNQSEVREVAGITGIPAQVIQIICLQHGCTPKDAVQIYRQSMEPAACGPESK